MRHPGSYNALTGRKMKRHYYIENADTLNRESDIYTVRREAERAWRRLNKRDAYIYLIITEYM